MRASKGFLVIADISGYTQFVRSHTLRHVPIVGKRMRHTSERHAEIVITDLLEVIIEAVGDSMSVNKLEGDAIFFVKESENPESDVQLIVPTLLNIFAAFQRRLYELIYCQACLCDCCDQMGDLKVKLVAHVGEFFVKQIAHFEEVAGEDVILIHRLLKNRINRDEYFLVTQPFYEIAKGALGELQFEPHSEDLDLGLTELAVHFPNSESVHMTSSPTKWWSRMQKMRAYFAEPRSREGLQQRLFS